MRDDVTVCIPTFPGREHFAARAAASAEGQARTLVHCDAYQPQSRDRACVTWWEAVYRATTPYVVLLFDDDWLKPGFIDAACDLMADDVAYVVGEADIHFDDGSVRTNLNLPKTTGHYPAKWIEDWLLRMPLTISTACCLFRRSDLLSCLLVGGVPLASAGRYANAGPDALVALLPLLKYPRVGWIKEPLVNLGGGQQSTTMEALSSADGRAALKAAYNSARSFYLSIKRGLTCA